MITMDYKIIVTLMTESNGVTAEKVNDMEKTLARIGLDDNVAPGIVSFKFACVTHDPTGLSEYVTPIVYTPREDVINDEWYALEAFNITRGYTDILDKLVPDAGSHDTINVKYIDAKWKIRHGAFGDILSAAPHNGARRVYEESAVLTDNEIEYLKSNKVDFIRAHKSWDDPEAATKYASGNMSFGIDTLRSVYNKFKEDPYSIQQTHGSNWQKFLETEIFESEKLFIYSHATASAVSYIPNSLDRDEHLNSRFASEVCCDFPERYLGGIPDDKTEEEKAQIYNARLFQRPEPGNHDVHAGINGHVAYLNVEGTPEDLFVDRFYQLYINTDHC